MQSVVDRLEFKGAYVAVGGYATGKPVTTVHSRDTEMLAYYTRLPTVGDKTKATSYTHIRYHLSGRYYRTFEKYLPVGGVYQWVYDGHDNPPLPMQHVIPGIEIRNGKILSLSPPTSIRDSLDNNLLSQLSQQKYSLGESLGEVVETSAFILEKSEHLMRVLVDLKRGHLSDALKQLGIRKSYMRKDLSHRWLEAQFAIRPLIGEIQQAIALANEGLSTKTTLHVKARARKTVRSTGLSHDQLAPYEANWLSYGFITASVELDALRAAMQLGLGNPVSILWNILPLSWLVDYVVNIGEIIDGFGATSGLTFVTGCYSDTLSAKAHVPSVTKLGGDMPRFHYWYTGAADCEGFQRTPMDDFPLPKLRFKLPLNVNQIANVSALVRAFLIGSRS